MRGAVAQLYILGYMAGSQPVSLVAVLPERPVRSTVRERRSYFKQRYSMIFEITDDGQNRQDFY